MSAKYFAELFFGRLLNIVKNLNQCLKCVFVMMVAAFKVWVLTGENQTKACFSS